MTHTISVDGVDVGPDTDVVALLRRQLVAADVWTRPQDQGPQDGVWRAMSAAAGTPVENRLVDALQTLMVDDDTDVRGQAIGLAEHYASQLEPTRLLALLTEHPDLFEGVRSSGSSPEDPDLAWGLLRVMAASPSSDQAVRDRIRTAATDPQHGTRVLAGLARHDPDWVAEHAPELVQGERGRAAILLFNLDTPERREQLVRSLASASPEARAEVGHAVAQHVRDEDEQQHLQSLLE